MITEIGNIKNLIFKQENDSLKELLEVVDKIRIVKERLYQLESTKEILKITYKVYNFLDDEDKKNLIEHMKKRKNIETELKINEIDLLRKKAELKCRLRY